jgi:hypothetical protein
MYPAVVQTGAVDPDAYSNMGGRRINAKINQASALALSRANSSALMVPVSSNALASLI